MQAQIAALQHATVVIGEHREQHEIAKPRLRRVPGSQSTSKYEAKRLAGPFSSTSHHQGLSALIAM